MSYISVQKGAQYVKNSERARICMSVGHKLFEGEKLSSFLTWCCANFRTVHLIVADSLQRFNYPRTYSDGERALIAAKDGDEWILRNQICLSRFTNIIKVSRWREITNHPDFFTVYEALTKLYLNNAPFRSSVDRDVNSFKSRTMGKLTSLTESEQLQYILEELAVICLLESSEGSVEVYPGSQIYSHRFFLKAELPIPLRALSDCRFVEVRIRECQLKVAV